MKMILRKTILGLALAPMLVAPFAQDRVIGKLDTTRTILVSGTAEATAAPDQAVVRLGATVQTPQADVAQARVNEIMQKAINGVQKLGVNKKAIATSSLTLSPVYAHERNVNVNEGPRVVGFRASNTIEVTLEDMKLVGRVIDAGIAAGANELQGVSFGLKNDFAQRNEALTRAAREARTKAETIAKALDLRLMGVTEVNEGGVQVIPYQENFTRGRMMMAADASMKTPVEPGEVRVQANVTVRYEIAPR